VKRVKSQVRGGEVVEGSRLDFDGFEDLYFCDVSVNSIVKYDEER